MEGTELRPGNYVLDVPSNQHKIVYGISHLEGFDVAFVHYKNEFDKPATFLIQPIELTQEWLIKFGFKKRKNQHRYHWENKIVIMEFSDGGFMTYTGYDIRYSPMLEYVHELQNLYYALTGKELVLTP